MAPWAHLTLTTTTGSNRDCRFQRASQGDNTMSFSGARTSHISPLVRQAGAHFLAIECLFQAYPLSQDHHFRRLTWQGLQDAAHEFEGDLERAAWLPFLAEAVATETESSILECLAEWPLPEQLPPEAVPWHAALVKAWKGHHLTPGSYGPRHLAALRAQVALDRCAPPGTDGCLPMLLREIQAISGKPRYIFRYQLTVPARWQPAPGITPDPEDLRQWMTFWKQQQGPVYDFGANVLSLQALLNLAEAGFPLDGHLPGELLHGLSRYIEMAAVGMATEVQDPLEWLTFWKPGPATPLPLPALREVACAWWHATRSGDPVHTPWETLMAWERKGLLKRCSIHLLPHLMTTVRRTRTPALIRTLSRWEPSCDAGSPIPEEVPALYAYWQTLAAAKDPQLRQAGLTGCARLLNSRVLSHSHRQWLETACRNAIRTEPTPGIRLWLSLHTSQQEIPATVWAGFRQAWLNRREEPDMLSALITDFARINGFRELRDGGVDGWSEVAAQRRQRQFGRDLMQRHPGQQVPRRAVWRPAPERVRQVTQSLAEGQIPPLHRDTTGKTLLRRLPAASRRPAEKTPPGMPGPRLSAGLPPSPPEGSGAGFCCGK
jgi:hypothetical protein